MRVAGESSSLAGVPEKGDFRFLEWRLEPRKNLAPKGAIGCSPPARSDSSLGQFGGPLRYPIFSNSSSPLVWVIGTIRLLAPPISRSRRVSACFFRSRALEAYSSCALARLRSAAKSARRWSSDALSSNVRSAAHSARSTSSSFESAMLSGENECPTRHSKRISPPSRTSQIVPWHSGQVKALGGSSLSTLLLSFLMGETFAGAILLAGSS